MMIAPSIQAAEALPVHQNTPRTRAERVQWLLRELPRLYPDAHCALHFRSPWELIVATVLSAQCTDERVNKVTPALFNRLPAMTDFAEVSQEELEKLVHSTGFFRNKAKNLRACAKELIEKFHGKIPRDIDILASLPGIGRKTANVVLGNAFDLNQGMVVDTHIGRLSRRLGLTSHEDPVKVERDLMRHFPSHTWKDLSHWLISHGRAVCKAQNPACPSCPLAEGCPSAGKFIRLRDPIRTPKTSQKRTGTVPNRPKSSIRSKSRT
jgi:endonuclease III